MENRTNQVIELENSKEYLVLRQVVYKGNTYYVTNEVRNDGEDFDKELIVLKEIEEDDRKYVDVVTNREIINTIMEHIA